MDNAGISLNVNYTSTSKELKQSMSLRIAIRKLQYPLNNIVPNVE